VAAETVFMRDPDVGRRTPRELPSRRLVGARALHGLEAAMPSEVKGLWFVVARRYIVDHHGPELVERMAAQMSESCRPSLIEPLRSEWYPEACLQESLGAFYELVAQRDDRRMLAAMEDCTLQGINRFFEVLLRLTTPSFVMKKSEVLWRYVRRGQGALRVETEESRAICRYVDFPYFDDVTYRLLALGTLRPLASLAQGTTASARVIDFGKTWLDVEVSYS
jgi:hypothetical protein